IVTDDRKLLEAEVLHHFDLIEGHRALGVVRVVLPLGRLAAVAISAQIGYDHCTCRRELWRDQAPRDVRLRGAVQQQEGGTLTTDDPVDLGAARRPLEPLAPG